MPTATELDTWYGVQYKNGKLTNLDLGGNNLVGTIHQDLGNLSELKLLALYENELTGPIPSQLGSLANMNILLLGENELSGSIPPELGNLSNLTQLDLSDNKLTGSIPSELGSLTSLTNFSLHTNDLNGSIPHQLGSLAKLRFFWVHSNALTDSIPAQLGSLAELEQLKLDDNALTGTVPSELGRLSKLKYLHLDSNRLSGPLPDSLTHLSILTSLKFSNNDGLCAPSEVASATGLKTVFHHHCAGFVETPAEIAQFLARSDPEDIGLVFDTGHYAFGAGSSRGVLDGLRRFGDRITYVHFKDCHDGIATESHRLGGGYFESIAQGVFCELGQGGVDFAATLQWLRQRQYRGWIVVEQDVLPGMGAPKESAARNRAFLRTIGL